MVMGGRQGAVESVSDAFSKALKYFAPNNQEVVDVPGMADWYDPDLREQKAPEKVGLPKGFDSIEGVFKKFSPGEKVTHGEAELLHKQGRMFGENNFNEGIFGKPIYDAPEGFYQGLARNRTSQIGPEIIEAFDATSEITSPVWKPVMEYIDWNPTSGLKNRQGAWWWADEETKKQKLKEYETEQAIPLLEKLKETHLWSPETTQALTNLVTGKAGIGETIDDLSTQFENRPIAEQLVGSVLGDPSFILPIGEAKALSVGTMAFLGGLPSALSRTPKVTKAVGQSAIDFLQESPKLLPLAKDAGTNMALNSYRSTKEGYYNFLERAPRDWDSTKLFLQESFLDKYTFVNKLTAAAEAKWKLNNPNIAFPDRMHATMWFSLLNGVPNSARLQADEAFTSIKKILNGTDAAYVNEYLRVKHLMSVLDIMPEKEIQAGYNTPELLQRKLDAMAREFEGTDGYANIEKASAVVRDVYKDLLIKMDNANMIPKKSTDDAFETLGEQLQNMYPWYNPISYVDDAGQVLTRGMENAQNASKARNPLQWLTEQMPENAQLSDPLSIFEANIFKIEHMIHENKTKKAFIDMMNFLDDKNFPGSMTIKLADERFVAAEIAQGTTRRVSGPGVELAPGIVVAPTRQVGPQIWKKRAPSTNVKNRISYLEYHTPEVAKRKGAGGIKVFEVGDDAYRMNQYMRLLPQGGIEKVMRHAQSPFRAAWITLNPDFILKSLVVDSITTSVMAGVMPHKVGLEVIAQMKSVFRDNPYLNDMIRSGGDVSGFLGDDGGRLVEKMLKQQDQTLDDVTEFETIVDDFDQVIGYQKIIDEDAVPKKASVLEINQANYREVYDPRKYFDVLQELGHKAELAPRVAVYRNALENGFSPQRAAYMAREATVDFQRSGVWMKQINKAYLFSNVAVQGAYLSVKAAKRNPEAFMIGMSGLFTTAAALYLQNREFEEYSKLNPEDRAKLGVMFPSNEFDRFGNKIPHYIALTPINRELAIPLASFNYMFEKIDKALQDVGLLNEGTNVPVSVYDTAGTILKSVDPLTAILGSGSDSQYNFGTSLVPTELGRVFAEMSLNTNDWTGQPIIPEDQINSPRNQQWNEDTSRLARVVGPAVRISPYKVDHLMKNGVMKDVFMIIDRLIALGDGQDIQAEAYLAELEEQISFADDPKDHTNIRKVFFNQELSKDALSQGFNRTQMEKRIKELEYRQEKSGEYPFVSNIVDSFIIKRGNHWYESGLIAAEKQTGMSAKHSREVSKLSNSWFDMFGKDKLEKADTKIYDFFMNPKQITYDPDTGQFGDDAGYSANQYMAELREMKNMYRLFIDNYVVKSFGFSYNDQGEKVSNYRGVDQTDKKQYEKWKEIIFTVGGQLEDTRSEARVYAMGLNSIEIEDYSWAPDPGKNSNGTDRWDSDMKNWSDYYEKRESYKNSIKQQYGAQMLADVMAISNENKSAMQLIQEAQFEKLRPYWDIQEWVIDSLEKAYPGDTRPGGKSLRQEWQEYSALKGTSQDAYKFDPAFNQDPKTSREGFFNDIKNDTDNFKKQFLEGSLVRKSDGTYKYVQTVDEFKNSQLYSSELEQILIEWEIKGANSYVNELNEGFIQQYVQKFQ